MKLYLEPTLAGHRHGRFFISQLDAAPADDYPHSGLLLMHGKVFQDQDTSQQEILWEWASQPGRTLLLLPPYKSGEVFKRLDWLVAAREGTPVSNDGIVPDTLCSEVTLSLTGNDGEFDRTLGHQWKDYTINTRFIKQHHGTGVFSATTLPLWSISLLDHARETLDWLESLMALAGHAAAEETTALQAKGVQLQPTDYTLMVCMRAWDLYSAESVTSVLSQGKFSLISIPELDVVEGIRRLKTLGLIDDNGLTDLGVDTLNESPYGHYVQVLKEETAS